MGVVGIQQRTNLCFQRSPEVEIGTGAHRGLDRLQKQPSVESRGTGADRGVRKMF